MATYHVLYRRDPNFRFDPNLTVDNIGKTHVLLKFVEAKDLEDLFFIMQGENWSSGEGQAEAQALIRRKGLSHTSMSVGDAAYCREEHKLYQVDFCGWKEVPRS